MENASSSEGWAYPVDFDGNTVRQLLSETSDVSATATCRPLMTPKDVLATYTGALTFGEQGLRSAQFGALHSVLGYWTTGRNEPATVVMPTGTGKTETMLALLVAARIPRLLVLVPSNNLREQIAGKFERLGILQELKIVNESAAKPVVGRMTKSLAMTDVAGGFAAACNVIVATPNVLQACTEDARLAILDACTHLFVDEAHHVEARTWSQIRFWFSGKRVVQFTATPFREDGRHVAGRMIYTYPLKKAQEEGFFAPINYTSILDFSDPDRALAVSALARLRADLDAGHDHLLMARARTMKRAEALAGLYAELAPDLKPVLLHSQLSERRKRAALAGLRSRGSKVIVCVNMLGEGFDLPELKIAAIHDAQKSLAVTLQFIGRFTRGRPGGTNLGAASAFVIRPDSIIDTRLRSLYAEDADWNHVLSNLSESAVEAEAEIGEFEAGFTSLPGDVAMSNLMPKLSTTVYKAPSDQWNPDAIYELFGPENLLSNPIGLNLQAGVAWFVVEQNEPVRWSDSKTLLETTYELFVLYFDAERRLLYINNSANDGFFEDVAEAVLGQGAVRIEGACVYRVMADIVRLIPTNVGVLDVRSQFRRFSMHVGPDVSEGFPSAEARTKTQTHIAGSGFRNGTRVSISAGLKGRIWSPSTAETLKQWRDWCDEVGPRLLDESIRIDDIMANFIIPEQVEDRPNAAVIALEWPWDLYMAVGEGPSVEHAGSRFPLLDMDLEPDHEAVAGPVVFDVATEHWAVPYQLTIKRGILTYQCLGPEDLVVHTGKVSLPLSEWLTRRGLTVQFHGDLMLQANGILLRLRADYEPYARDRLLALDWTGTDLKMEAQRAEKREESIQYRAIRDLLAERDWDVILDDDGSGEVADIVAFALNGDRLLVRLVHCKYAHGPAAGTRIEDLYDVCGQAMKSVRWRNETARLFAHLEKRARRKFERTASSPWEAGDLAAFYILRDRAHLIRNSFEMVIVQPGLSQANATEEQLELLSATELYVRQTADASLAIYCSP